MKMVKSHKGRMGEWAKGRRLTVATLVLLSILFSCKDPEEKGGMTLPKLESCAVVPGTTGPVGAMFSFIVISDECAVSEVGMCWNTSVNPTIALDTKIILDNPGVGSFNAEITNLQANTTYYLRAFATCERGTGYSSQISFTTTELEPPEVGAIAVREGSISYFKAVLQSSIESQGNQPVTSAGVCWSKTANPTIEQSPYMETSETPDEDESSESEVRAKTDNGPFELEITELTDNTTYYARSFAKSAAGIDYSEQITFTTLQLPAFDYIVDFNTVITENFVGIGTQYNSYLHLPCSYDDYGITEANLPDLEAKVKNLGSQYVRIFLSNNCWSNSPAHGTPGGGHSAEEYKESLFRVVELANATVKVINITYWSSSTPAAMPTFAEYLYEMIVTRGFTNVKQITIQNEVNLTDITMPNYQLTYRRLDQELIKLGIRDRIDFVAGDLVANNQKEWFEYIANNFSDICQGYSSHVYWNANDAPKPENRQKDIMNIINDMGANKRPLYITEFGARNSAGGNPGNYTGIPSSGFPGDLAGMSMSETNIGARQHLMFIIRGMNRGIAGFVKWDCFKARYVHTGEGQNWSCIGDGTDGYPLRPIYHALRLFTLTSESGWKVVGVSKEVNASKILTAVKSPDGAQQTVYALNTTNAAYDMSISGLTPNKTYHLVAWNKNQDNLLTVEQDMTADDNGILFAPVSALSMVAITTLQVSL